MKKLILAWFIVQLTFCIVVAAPFNGSDLIDEPFNTTFSPFTDLFENTIGNGQIFFLFPISVIAVALFVKTREPAMVSVYMIATGILAAGGSMFFDAIYMGVIFTIFAALGLIGLFTSLFRG